MISALLADLHGIDAIHHRGCKRVQPHKEEIVAGETYMCNQYVEKGDYCYSCLKDMEPDDPSFPKTCQYTFSRGSNRGTKCGAPTVKNSNYCRNCNKKKRCNVPGIPDLKSSLNSVPTISNLNSVRAIPNPQPRSIEVTIYPSLKDHVRESTHGFIISITSMTDSNLSGLKCVGRDVNNTGTVSPLTEEDHKILNSLGLPY